ncbi:MAG TPA: RCC1 domain-containing protein, partial [Saprospiraceae bacterium]|nr:RCC1 domain-containing protein [Saprospiraceae bacterium]
MKIFFWMFTTLLMVSAAVLCVSCETVEPTKPVSWANEYESLAAGGNHSMVLEPNGTLWTWGSNVS